MVFNDRFRCDAAYVLDGEGSERNGPGSKPGRIQIARRRGMKKAIAALARRLAVIMHRTMVDGTRVPLDPRTATTAA